MFFISCLVSRVSIQTDNTIFYSTFCALPISMITYIAEIICIVFVAVRTPLSYREIHHLTQAVLSLSSQEKIIIQVRQVNIIFRCVDPYLEQKHLILVDGLGEYIFPVVRAQFFENPSRFKSSHTFIQYLGLEYMYSSL